MIVSAFLGASGAAAALGELEQRVVDSLIDLDALPGAAGALAIRALPGNADLGDAILWRRRLDRSDLGAQRASVVLERYEQIGLERDEEVAGVFLAAHPTAEHAERVHREGQRVALVSAKRQEGAPSRRSRVGGGAAVLVDGHALRKRDAQALPELQIGAHEGRGAQ